MWTGPLSHVTVRTQSRRWREMTAALPDTTGSTCGGVLSWRWTPLTIWGSLRARLVAGRAGHVSTPGRWRSGRPAMVCNCSARTGDGHQRDGGRARGPTSRSRTVGRLALSRLVRRRVAGPWPCACYLNRPASQRRATAKREGLRRHR